MANNEAYVGFQTPSSASSDLNAVDFMVRMILGQLATATVVRIEAVTSAGELAPCGTVDVLPLVAQVDGEGTTHPHGTVYGLPYFRLQGGADAVIIDPVVGDIGIAIFASRDISSVKTNKGPSPPGSQRQFSMSDGMYLGGLLNGTPTQYFRFSADGIEVVSPTKVTIRAPAIELDSPVTGTSTAGFSGDVTAVGTSVHTHKHGGVTAGAAQTGVPV